MTYAGVQGLYLSTKSSGSVLNHQTLHIHDDVNDLQRRSLAGQVDANVLQQRDFLAYSCAAVRAQTGAHVLQRHEFMIMAYAVAQVS